MGLWCHLFTDCVECAILSTTVLDEPLALVGVFGCLPERLPHCCGLIARSQVIAGAHGALPELEWQKTSHPSQFSSYSLLLRCELVMPLYQYI